MGSCYVFWYHGWHGRKGRLIRFVKITGVSFSWLCWNWLFVAIDHGCHHINVELYCITAESSVNVLSLIKCRSYWLSPVASVLLKSQLMALQMLLIVLGVALAMLQYGHGWHVGSIRVKTVKVMVSTNVHCFCCVVLCFPLLWVLRTLHYVRATYIAMCTCVAVFPGGSKHTFLVFILLICLSYV